MSYRIDPARRGWRRASGGSRWPSALVTLAVAGSVAAAWACAPRVPARTAAVAPASHGFVAVATARPLTRPAAAPAPSPGAELRTELAASVRAAEAPAAPAAPPVAPAEPRREAPAFRIAAEHEMSSTMYCLKGNTRTGVRTRDGIAAADPAFLPLGSVVRLRHADGRPLGVFVVMDTGGAVKGAKIDVYVDDCAEATRWGRRRVVAEVLALGRAGG